MATDETLYKGIALKTIYHLVKDKVEPSTQKLRIITKRFKYDDLTGLLWKSCASLSILQLVVPDILSQHILGTPYTYSVRRGLIFLAHNSVLGQHQGTLRVLNHLNRRYWWPKLASLVRLHISTCQICQMAKATIPQLTGEIRCPMRAHSPRQCWSIDFCSWEGNSIFVALGRGDCN